MQFLQEHGVKLSKMILNTWLVTLTILTSIQCAVIKIDKNKQSHQVVFKRIGNYATNVHYHHIRIPVNLTKIISTPTEAMEHIKVYIKDVYEQTVRYNRDEKEAI